MMKEKSKVYYSFRFPDGNKNEGLFAEFLPGPDGISLYASEHAYSISEEYDYAKDLLKEILLENKDVQLEIVKVEVTLSTC